MGSKRHEIHKLNYLYLIKLHNTMIKRTRTTVKRKAVMIQTSDEDKEADELVDTVDPGRPGCRLGEITWTSFTSADVTFLMASSLIITTSCSVRLGTDPEKRHACDTSFGSDSSRLLVTG